MLIIPLQLQSLFYQIGDVTYEFTAQAQQWPRSLNYVFGGDPDSTYLIVADLGRNSGRGFDCGCLTLPLGDVLLMPRRFLVINGLTWLQHFYSVLDTDNKRVGIANLA
jgi:cathepsin E